MSADRSARHEDSSYTTIPLKCLLVIREYSRESAVRLFDEPQKATALPQIDTNVRGSSGGIRFALRRRVVFRAPVDQEGAAE